MRFQQIKAEEKYKATVRARREAAVKPLKDQIRQANPQASERIVEQILEAHLRTQAHNIRVKGKQVEVVKV